jgi:hypothetical protein
MAFIQRPLTASPYLVGPDQKEIHPSEDIIRDLTDDSWLNQQIQSAPGWDKLTTESGGLRRRALLARWRSTIRTPIVLDDDHVYVGWSEYWSSIITLRLEAGDAGTGNKNSKGGDLGADVSFGFAPSEISKAQAAGTAQAGVDTKSVPLSILAKRGITKQLGLLEDDILYNLSLLCKNVLEPVKAKYPDIKIESGFRQVNTGIGQHERGQAVDIIIPSAEDTLLYEVADFIAKTLQFDQVILNYSMRRSPWIHVSFSSTGLRRSALTRDFDDTFHTGLFLITHKIGEDRAIAQREQDEYITKVNAELTILEKRQTDLNPQTVIGDATAPGMGSASGAAASGGGDCGNPDGTVPNERGTVDAVFAALAPGGVPWVLTTHEGGGDFTNAVVHALGPEWGHVGKSGGQTQHNGHAVDAIAYKSPTPLYNGKWVQVIDIIGGVGAAGATPQWHPVCAPVGDTPDGDLDPNGPWWR